MAPVTTEIQVTAGGDDATYYGSPLAYSSTATTHQIGTHAVVARGPWTGFRFQIPTDIIIDHITDVYLSIRTNNGGLCRTLIRVEQDHAPAWADTTANRPRERWEAVGSTGQVAWEATLAVTTRYSTPSFTDRAVSAITALDRSTEYLGVILGADPDWTGASAQGAQVITRDSGTTANRPYLVIVTEVPADEPPIVPTANSTARATGLATSYAALRVPAATATARASTVVSVVNAAVTTTAPSLTTSPGTPAATISSSIDVTATAPGLTLLVTSATTASSAEITLAAPSVSVAPASGITTAADTSPSTAAPGLATSPGSVTVSITENVSITATAPTTVTSPGSVVVSITEDASVTITAPSVGLTAPDVAVTVAAAGEAITTAPEVALTAPDVTVTVDASVVLTAPGVQLTAGSGQVAGDTNVLATAVEMVLAAAPATGEGEGGLQSFRLGDVLVEGARVGDKVVLAIYLGEDRVL